MNGSFTCHKSATWDGRLYFPSEERHAEDLFALKNSRTLVPEASMLTPRQPKPLTAPIPSRISQRELLLSLFIFTAIQIKAQKVP
jgi:hypothetical protein